MDVTIRPCRLRRRRDMVHHLRLSSSHHERRFARSSGDVVSLSVSEVDEEAVDVRNWGSGEADLEGTGVVVAEELMDERPDWMDDGKRKLERGDEAEPVARDFAGLKVRAVSAESVLDELS